MKTPQTSKHFKRVLDPVSGVPHYVLTTRLCEYQQGFYFVNNSMSNDGRYLWFYAIPRAIYDTMNRNLGYVDFLEDEVVICYDTLFDDATPYVDGESGTVYYTKGNVIYKREPGKDKRAEVLCRVDIGLWSRKLATHLTMTSDKKHFFLDVNRADFGCVQGLVDIETGHFTPWAYSKVGLNVNHGQINPKCDELALCACDGWVAMADGAKHSIPNDENGVYQRLWTVTPDGKYTCYPAAQNYATHEWWSADGKKIYYVNDFGIQYVDITNGEARCIHECKPWHAFCTADERYYIFDEKMLDRYHGKWYRGCPAAVRFYNRETDKEITIVTEMPENGFTPSNQTSYHIDPHPRITENERYVVFSTSELGGCDLAVAFMDELIALTKQK